MRVSGSAAAGGDAGTAKAIGSNDRTRNDPRACHRCPSGERRSDQQINGAADAQPHHLRQNVDHKPVPPRMAETRIMRSSRDRVNR